MIGDVRKLTLIWLFEGAHTLCHHQAVRSLKITTLTSAGAMGYCSKRGLIRLVLCREMEGKSAQPLACTSGKRKSRCPIPGQSPENWPRITCKHRGRSPAPGSEIMVLLWFNLAPATGLRAQMPPDGQCKAVYQEGCKTERQEVCMKCVAKQTTSEDSV